MSISFVSPTIGLLAIAVASPAYAQPAAKEANHSKAVSNAPKRPLRPGPARATLEPLSVHIVGRAAPKAPFADRPTEARLADPAELAVVMIAREQKPRGRSRRVYIMDDLGSVRVRGRAVRQRERRSWQDLGAQLGALSFRWSAIEPHAWREDGKKAPNGTDTRFHSNVSLQPETYGKWLGYDEITYFETELSPWSQSPKARRRPASARPPAAQRDIHGGLGTLRYKVEVKLADGRILTTPGAEATDRQGILPSVHRVSIRRDDTFLGHLTAYFMVPEVFGSAGKGPRHQTERFTGADCADVLTGALRRAGYRRVWHTNVAGLTKYARHVARESTLDERGSPSRAITGIAVGDIIRIDYGGAAAALAPRVWDHVAALYEDRSDPAGPHRGGPNGALDPFDLIVHMGHPHLVVEPLASQAPARIDVVRWQPRKLGRRR